MRLFNLSPYIIFLGCLFYPNFYKAQIENSIEVSEYLKEQRRDLLEDEKILYLCLKDLPASQGYITQVCSP